MLGIQIRIKGLGTGSETWNYNKISVGTEKENPFHS